MKLHSNTSQDIVFIDKPAGFSTHSPDQGKLGLVEIFEIILQKKLYPIHRLDKETTGCLAFATTAEAARVTFELFKNHQVKKNYWFLTDRKSNESRYHHRSLIEKSGNSWVSKSEGEANSETVFTRIKRSPFFELWEAEPVSGKPHQIRLHAQDLGLPILGDTVHGGTAFPHLCLHSQFLHIPGHAPHLTTPPRFFERMALLKNPELSQWVAEIDRRQRLFNFLQNPEQCLRLIHQKDLFMDQLGEILWTQWQKPEPPTAEELQCLEFVASLLGKKMIVRKTANRGQDPLAKKEWLIGAGEIPENWQGSEGSLQFSFSRVRGLSAGLFLDQKNNRAWVQQHSSRQRVLNLFSYTCGFGVAAAVGGAQQVTNVDVSSDFLQWGRENFVLNGVEPSPHEFFVQDSILFLKACVKKGRQFDLVICDPPTFGRHKGGVFSLEKDLKALLELCGQVLAPQGKIMFCCNYEKWDLEDLHRMVQKSSQWKALPVPLPAWDYELPNQPRLMKTLLLTPELGRKKIEQAQPGRHGKTHSGARTGAQRKNAKTFRSAK